VEGRGSSVNTILLSSITGGGLGVLVGGGLGVLVGRGLGLLLS
jgi:hypothetical protein